MTSYPNPGAMADRPVLRLGVLDAERGYHLCRDLPARGMIVSDENLGVLQIGYRRAFRAFMLFGQAE